MAVPTIICVGEALVDFLPEPLGVPLRRVRSFRPTLGGGPANTAVGLARLGHSVGLLTRLSDDEIGRLARDYLEAEGVDTGGIVADPTRRTGITFVQVDPTGDRSFLFYRRETAECAFEPSDLDMAWLRGARAVHLCTNPMRHALGRQAVLIAAQEARAAGALVCGDANLRWHLWAEPTSCRDAGLELVATCDLFKANDDEACRLTGAGTPMEAARALHELGPELAVVTLGAAGCCWAGAAGEGQASAPAVEVVDTTGAGDAFAAGLLAVLYDAPRPFEAERIQSAVTLANALGAKAVTHAGATGSR